MPLKLDRPLVVFDIESTGVNAREDRIIELAAIRVEPDGAETSRCWLLNPTVPIPPETTAIHGITEAIVAQCPTFADAAADIAAFFRGADLAGFNSDRFDVPCLDAEFARVGRSLDDASRRHVDAQRIYHRMEPRDLTAAVSFYCGRSHAGAHGAEADARATLDVLRAQLAKYADLPHDVAALDAYLVPRDPMNLDRLGTFRWNSRGDLLVNFGRKKGAKLIDLARNEPGYLRWITKGDFPAEVRQVCQDLLDGCPLPPPPAMPKVN